MKNLSLLIAFLVFGVLTSSHFVIADGLPTDCASNLTHSPAMKQKCCHYGDDNPSWCPADSTANDMRSDCQQAWQTYQQDVKDADKNNISQIQDLQKQIQEAQAKLAKVQPELQQKLTKIDHDRAKLELDDTNRSKQIYDKINSLNTQLDDFMTTKTKAAYDQYQEDSLDCSHQALADAQALLLQLQQEAKARATGATMMGSVSAGFGATPDIAIVKKEVLVTGWVNDKSGKAMPSYQQCMATAKRKMNLVLINLKTQEAQVRKDITSETQLLDATNKEAASQMALLLQEKTDAQNSAMAEARSLQSQVDQLNKQLTMIATDRTALNTDVSTVVGDCCRKVDGEYPNPKYTEDNKNGDETLECKDASPPYPSSCLQNCTGSSRCINVSGYGGSAVNTICQNPSSGTQGADSIFKNLFLSGAGGDAIYSNSFGGGANH